MHELEADLKPDWEDCWVRQGSDFSFLIYTKSESGKSQDCGWFEVFLRTSRRCKWFSMVGDDFFFAMMRKKMSLKLFLQPTLALWNFKSHKCRRWIFQWLGKKWRTERQRPIICLATAHARVRRRWGDSMTPTPVRLPAALETLSSEKSFKEINDFHRPPRQEEEINSWMEVSVERRATTKKNLRDKAKAEKWNKTQIYEPPGK